MLPKNNNLRWLQQEINTWVTNGFITTEQATQIRSQYDFEQAPPWYLRTSFILKGVAILFVIMGLFLLISHNWHQFSITVRMLITLTPLLGAAGFAIKHAFDNNREATELALFFCCLTLGLNIFMQAQIFHISSYYPNGILWWILGSLPVLLYFRTTLLNICLQVLFVIWISQQISYEQFTFLGVLIIASFLYVVYQKKDAISILATLVSGYLFLYNVIQVTEGWGGYRLEEQQLIFFTCNYALLALVILSWSKKLTTTKVYQFLEIVGTWLIFFFTFWWTFENFVKHAIKYTDLMIINYVLFIVALGIYFLNKSYRSIDISMAFVCASFFIIWSVVALPVKAYLLVSDNFNMLVNPITWAMNAFFLGLGLFKIFYGLKHQVKYQFMSGIFFLMTLAIARYLDFFDNYIVMAVIFMLSGLIIYLLNNFWNKRYQHAQ